MKKIVAEQSGHFIQPDQFDLMIDSICEVVEAAWRDERYVESSACL